MSYLALVALAALDAVGYGIVAPVVPTIADEAGVGPVVIGALVTCFGLGQLGGYPLAGGIVERWAAPVLLVASLAVTAVGDVGFVVGSGLEAYFPARLLQGLGAAGLWLGVVFAVLERYPGSEYARLSGVVAAYSIGSVVGPALGGLGGISAPFLAHLALVVAGVALVALLGPARVRPAFVADRDVLRSAGFGLAAAGILVVALGFGTLEGPLPLHFAVELSQGAIALLYVGAAVLVATG
ncbi:MAG: MFS transporter, partial [Actinomycetota bacterium]|nr:MFS transporter [Actinomycetota bacterium]